MSLLAFLGLNAGAAAAALALAAVIAGRSHPRRRLFVALCAWLLVVHSVVLAAGVVGRLSIGGVTAILGLVVVAAAWWARRAGAEDEVADDRPPLTTMTRSVSVAAIVTGVVWAWPHVTGATRLWIWDDYTYHMVYPAQWLAAHAIAAPTPDHAFTMQAWYPLSSSVVSAWFMLPFAGSRGDALAWVSLTALLYAGIVAGGAAELFARLGARPGAWAVPVVLFVTSQRIGVMASSFSDADLAQAAALFAAFVFAVPRGAGERPELRADLWWAALLSGLAIGMKVTAAPTALVVLAMLVWRAGAPGRRWRAVGRVALVFAVAWLATGGYWYVRNVVHTGNPVYPAAFLLWPGATFPHTTLREYAQEYGVRRAVSDALIVYLNWPRFHALLAVVGLTGVAAALVVRRGAMTRPQRFFASGALGITIITLGLLPSAPYSAGNGMTFAAGVIHWDSMRYVALLPILGWVALGVLIDAAAPARAVLGAGITVGALVASEMVWGSIALVLGAALVVALLVSRLDAPLPTRAAPVAAAVGAALIAGVVGWSHGAKAAATAAAFHREPLYGAAAAVLDRQPAGTRVAVFGDQWIYPTFGARHDLVPVRVDGNGRIATAPIGDAMTQGPLTVDRWTFRRNLAESAIGVVVVLHLPHPGRASEWPAQATALENVGGARLLYRDRAVGIWTLGD